LAMLNPDDFIPTGVHEGYKKNLTQLFCGNCGVEYLDQEAMSHFPNLEVLWLNDNRLSKLKGLDANFRIKHLYLHNNSITTVCDASCSLSKLRHLETLQLACNQLQDLKASLAILSKLPFLKKLQLHGNPLSLESSYRAAVIFAIPTLKQLDSALISDVERQAAVKLFTAKRIEKPMAFMTIPKIWDKPRKIPIGERSVGELQLAKEIDDATLRRAQASELSRVLTERQKGKPAFQITFAKAPSALLSPTVGAPITATKTFEFVARGRVPKLKLALGAFSLSPAAATAAASYGPIDGSNSVFVGVTAMGVLHKTFVSREVSPRHLADGRTAKLGFDEFLFHDSIYANAYDKVTQLMQIGQDDKICITLHLRESATRHTLATATVPLAAIMRDHTEKEYRFEGTPFYPIGVSAADSAPFATLDVGVRTDWGLSNMTAKEYGNSAFEFQRRRMASGGAGGASGGVDDLASQSMGAHFARDTFRVLTSKGRAEGSAGASELPPPPSGPGGIVFDAVRYAAYEKQKASLQPSSQSPQYISL